MKGDFTRSSFNREKHYSSVRQQQGRVQLDSDWNEELDILNHIERTTRIDVIGHCGGPIHDAGFEVTPAGGNLNLSAGRYYVEGLLCEKEADETITGQADLPNYTLPTQAGRYLAYLDVWERHVTALEDPEIREVALGGPDTATRTQVIAQVKLLAIANESCEDFEHPWVPPGAVSDGRLAARTQPAEPAPEPCIVPARAGYRRLENQLYRVEIHTAGGLNTATFKWSRENGSVVFRVVGQDGAGKLLLSRAPLDDKLGLAPGNWVELTDDTRDLRGEPGVLMQVLLVEDTVVTIDTATIADPLGVLAGSIDLTTFGPNTRLRRWESAGALTVEVPLTNDGFIELEDGVEVAFGSASTAFQVGDYWQIPARTATGDVLWPEDPAVPGQPEFQGRHGILHYYCALAIIGFNRQAWGAPDDCRDLFPPLTELPEGQGDQRDCCCCRITVGDGKISNGDFNNIQAAVNAAPAGSRVCILPGSHQLGEPVLIDDRDIALVGCGRSSHIRNNGKQPAFIINNSSVLLSDLFIDGISADPASVVVVGGGPLVIEHCRILNQQPTAPAPANHPAVWVGACQNVTIRDCFLIGLPAVVAQAARLDCHANRLAGGGLWLEDGCTDVEVADNGITDGQSQGITLGGFLLGKPMQVPGLRRIVLRDNRIANMGQSAIGSAVGRQGLEALGRIADLTIAHNRLEACGSNQEVLKLFDGQARGGIVVHGASGVRIHDNLIANHGLGKLPAVGICLTLAVGAEIRHNHIQDNGPQVGPGDVINGPTLQGGILVLPALAGGADLSGEFVRPGQPALQVHDNVVVTPAGQCLAAYGYGPMSVRDNAFTSRAIYVQPALDDDPTGAFGKALFEATTVALFNLGQNADRATKALPVGGGLVLVRDELLGMFGNVILGAEGTGPTAAGQLAYHGNQSDQIARQFEGQFANSAVALVSFGDAAAQDNQHITHMEEGVQLADWRVLAATARVQDNWVDELQGRAQFSLVVFGERFCHASHNQSMHCVYAAGGNVVERFNQVPNPAFCRELVRSLGTLLPQ